MPNGDQTEGRKAATEMDGFEDDGACWDMTAEELRTGPGPCGEVAAEADVDMALVKGAIVTLSKTMAELTKTITEECRKSANLREDLNNVHIASLAARDRADAAAASANAAAASAARVAGAKRDAAEVHANELGALQRNADYWHSAVKEAYYDGHSDGEHAHATGMDVGTAWEHSHSKHKYGWEHSHCKDAQ